MSNEKLYTHLTGIRDLVLKHSKLDISEAQGNEHVFRMILDALRRMDGIIEAYQVRTKNVEEMSKKGRWMRGAEKT